MLSWGISKDNLELLSLGILCLIQPRMSRHSAGATARSALGGSPLLSLCITPIPATMATFIKNPLSDDGWFGKEADLMHKADHPSHLIIKNLLCWGHPMVSIHTGYTYLYAFCPFRGISIHLPPNFFVTSFPITFLPSPWPSSQSVAAAHESL